MRSQIRRKVVKEEFHEILQQDKARERIKVLDERLLAQRIYFRWGMACGRQAPDGA